MSSGTNNSKRAQCNDPDSERANSEHAQCNDPNSKRVWKNPSDGTRVINMRDDPSSYAATLDEDFGDVDSADSDANVRPVYGDDYGQVPSGTAGSSLAVTVGSVSHKDHADKNDSNGGNSTAHNAQK